MRNLVLLFTLLFISLSCNTRLFNTHNNENTQLNAYKILPSTKNRSNEKIFVEKNFDPNEIKSLNLYALHQNKWYQLPLTIYSSKLDDFDYSFSANGEHCVICLVTDLGYVYPSVIDSIYQETFKCYILSLKNKYKIVTELSSEKANGFWNKDNQWCDENDSTVIWRK